MAKTKAKDDVVDLNTVRTEHTELATVDGEVPHWRNDWRRERIELIKKQVVPQGCTDAEFDVFIEQCKRTGLDPMKGECFLVERRTKINRNTPKEAWVSRFTFQPAENGMMARADDFPDFGGIRAAAVYMGEECLIDEDTVHHKYNPATRKGIPIGAWAQVKRHGRVLPVEWLPFGEYVQDTSKWKTSPQTMIVKCARNAALRRAYPNAFGGVYGDFEKNDDSQDQELLPPSQEGEQKQLPPSNKANALEERVVQRAQQTAAVPEGQRVTQKEQPSEPTARYGGKDFAGKKLSSLSDDELFKLADLYVASLHKSPNASWAADAQANLQEIRDEQKKRAAASMSDDDTPADDDMSDPPKEEREPGSDDGDDDGIPFGKQ